MISISLNDKLLYPVIAGFAASLLASMVFAYAVAAPPYVSSGTANTFFSGYLRKVANVSKRHFLYRTAFTQDFRNFEKWPTYDAFWRSEMDATAGPAIPMPGNPLAFTVTITFHPVVGDDFKQKIDYYLSCTGFISSMRARIWGCPLNGIRIDITEWVGYGAS